MPLAVLTFLVGIAYIPGLPSNAVVGRWLFMGIGAALMLWRIEGRWITPRDFHATRAHWIGTMLLVWIVFGFTWCVSGWDHLGGLGQWVVMAAVFCIAAEQRSLDACWKALAIAVTISAGFSVAQRFGINPVWSIYTAGDVGLFLSKNMATEAALLALIGAIGVRWWPLVPGPLVALWLVNSRSAFLGLAVAGIAWAVIRRREIGWRMTSVAAGAAAFVGGAGVIHGYLQNAKFSDRWEIWSAVVPKINLWGDGLGSMSIAWANYEFAHNEFIHYAFELGVGSMLIWGIVIYAMAAQRTLERCAMAAILAECLVYWPLHTPVAAFMAALVAGHLSGVRGRAFVAEFGGRTDRARGLQHPEFVGVGSLCAADVGRFDLPFRSQSAMVRREFRVPL